ncbi:XRE family transcriptional regulator [Agathobaculum butyriciproducens]|nr:XRE family transcriptional regulator [Agathobaculum butyriciproducens]RGC62182.1 XRE family transcriptional regulator [Agathobaculum butyriciproducens]
MSIYFFGISNISLSNIRYSDIMHSGDNMDRIKELRKAHGYKQIEFCKMLGISQATLSGYETGKYQPDNTMLVKIATLFNVSTDYLLGNTDIPAPSRPTVDDDDIKFALFGTTDIDDATLEDIKAYARFKREQYNKR